MFDIKNDPFYEYVREIVLTVGTDVLSEDQCKRIRQLWLTDPKPSPAEVVASYRAGAL
jgi:hypothetical protein